MEITLEQFATIEHCLLIPNEGWAQIDAGINTLPAKAAGQRQTEQPASGQCDSLCSRAWLQVARTAQALWQLAYDLHPHEPVDQSRCPGPYVRGVTACSGGSHQDRSGLAGLHKHQGPVRGLRCRCDAMDASNWAQGIRVASTASGSRISITASIRARKKSLGFVINRGQNSQVSISLLTLFENL